MPATAFKWVSIVGARPQFVKVAPICRAIERHNADSPASAIEHAIVHTGQHYEHELAELFFVQMGIPAAKFNLGVGSGSFGAQIARMCERLEPVLNDERPDFVILYGDTTSTQAGAIVAARLGIPIAHVEAGCRSYDMRMPEEQNRVIADHLSRVLFAPSASALSNLHREGIATDADPLTRRASIVGDVMHDALLHNRALAEQGADETLYKLGVKRGQYYLLTIHRAENTSDVRILTEILSSAAALDCPVIFPVHPRTRNILGDCKISVAEHIRQIAPVGFLEMLGLEQFAKAILTDSGGVQKEAFYLEIPCVTLRDRTEWPETVELGANRLAGTKKELILEAVAVATQTRRLPGSPYGNGDSATKIVSELLAESEYLNQYRTNAKFASA